ncbi:hypothetical protein [Isobaculum melis]|uniref:Uncharacterized protein n=1 Tax=Isobaculum melis TaxID=142588 RepID=A0A1H9PQL0_9LACT|nr:hypothetical protein [Isobaculum melis]SER50532.1 hypothetical protein SAMN04488559_10176 [Isobaculum melis]
MKIYIELKKLKNTLDYRILAEKMWFPGMELSHVGNTETFQESYELSLKWDKFLDSEEWNKKNSEFDPENIAVEPIRNQTILCCETKHVNILTVDKRALFIMVSELAKEVDGLISEDDMENWITANDFEKKHQAILNLTFEEANNISLKEDSVLAVINEPWESEV